MLKLVCTHQVFFLLSEKFLTNEFGVVFCWSKEADIFFDFLPEGLWDLLSTSIIFFKITHFEQRLLIDIICEESSFSQAVFENHETYTRLETICPKSTVDATIGPVHFSIACL